MSRLTRDGTAEPVSRDQILRRERGQGNIHFLSVQLTTSRIPKYIVVPITRFFLFKHTVLSTTVLFPFFVASISMHILEV